MIEYGGPPESWIARDGCPARTLGDPRLRRSADGLPSFEGEDNELVIYENLIASEQGFGNIMLWPIWYESACVIAKGGMVPLHHNETAWWHWRPCIYRRDIDGRWHGYGSQKELEWRYAMALMKEVYAEEDLGVLMEWKLDDPMARANARAEELLQDHLSPTQLVEWLVLDFFRVVGGETGAYYQVQRGNGFSEVDRITNDVIVSYCLHPEDWIPHADVALATKFNLEAPDLELKTVEGANGNRIDESYKRPLPRVKELARAADMERELLAA